MQNIWSTIVNTTEEKPWLWIVYVLALLIPVILISVFCFGKKSPSTASHAKKTDEFQPDDVVDEEMEEVIFQVFHPCPAEKGLSQKAAKKQESQSEEDNQEEKVEEQPKESASPSTSQARKARVRRVD
uniref:Calnexin n=1 Tax=Ditylenchus dipsaci TaxID=166011 RepID=A0A915CTQ8_9BILA